MTANLRSDSINRMFSDDLSVIVVDEAHNIEEKVRNSLCIKYPVDSINDTLFDLFEKVDFEFAMDYEINGKYSEINKAVERLNVELNRQIENQINKSDCNMKDADKFILEKNDVFKSAIEALSNLIKNISDKIEIAKAVKSNDISPDRAKKIISKINKLAQDFYDMQFEFQNRMYWIEKTGNIIQLVTCPANVDEYIRRYYFNRKYPTILVSATLTDNSDGGVDNMYSYFIKNTGFPKEPYGYLATPKPSPFLYDEHAMIYYSDDLPHPRINRNEFQMKAVERIIELLKITNGKALILFTSKDDMDNVSKLLLTKNLPYKIYAQSKSSSQKSVLKKFSCDTNSVLLGTGAYWEGINVSGVSLSQVIIFKLPFPIPDPIIDYKCKIAGETNKFENVLVPEMIIKLRQGVGRLIRSNNDTGIVSILDPRLGHKDNNKYKNTVWNSLPIKNKTCSLNELNEFYTNLSKNK